MAINPPLDAGKDIPWWKQPAALALFASNLIPLVGVLYFHWSLSAVMLLFWLDNVLIGLYMVARNRLARPSAA